MSPAKSELLDEIGREIVRILSLAAMLAGVCLILAAFSFATHPFGQNIAVNIGAGLITGGALSFVFDIQTRKINRAVSEGLRSEVIAELVLLLNGDQGLRESLVHLIDSHSLDSRLTSWEIMKSILSDDGQRKVFAGGIVNAFPLWAGKVPQDFLQSQKHLRILLKDGYSFFGSRKEEFKRRLRHKSYNTKIMILHPDYTHMQAVALMDPQKMQPALQIKDCRFAIKVMQEIRAELLRENIDIKDTVEFIGYHMVPTWTGFLGDSLAYVSLFFTRPHRGDLPTIVIRRDGDNNLKSPFYDAFENEYEELWRHSTLESSDSLFDYLI